MYISASLSIMSEELAPQRITALLSIEPTRSWKRGESIATAKGFSGASSGGWFLYSSELKSKDLAEHLDWLVSKIGSLSPQLCILQREGYMLSICCNLSSPERLVSFIVPPKTLRAISELGLELDCVVALNDHPKEASAKERKKERKPKK